MFVFNVINLLMHQQADDEDKRGSLALEVIKILYIYIYAI